MINLRQLGIIITSWKNFSAVSLENGHFLVPDKFAMLSDSQYMPQVNSRPPIVILGQSWATQDWS